MGLEGHTQRWPGGRTLQRDKAGPRAGGGHGTCVGSALSTELVAETRLGVLTDHGRFKEEARRERKVWRGEEGGDKECDSQSRGPERQFSGRALASLCHETFSTAGGLAQHLIDGSPLDL